MALEAVFTTANLVAIAGWLVLLLAPPRHRLHRLVPAAAVVALSAGYIVFAAYGLSNADGGFGSLADVRDLFQNDAALLAGWVHYLAFDLFVGCWIVHDAARRGIPRLIVAPLLVLTFLFGPAGYLAYLGLRATLARSRTAKPAEGPA